MIGGYDPRVRENLEHYEELRQVAIECKLTTSLYPDLSAQV
jgi:hypothetical protein